MPQNRQRCETKLDLCRSSVFSAKSTFVTLCLPRYKHAKWICRYYHQAKHFRYVPTFYKRYWNRGSRKFSESINDRRPRYL